MVVLRTGAAYAQFTARSERAVRRARIQSVINIGRHLTLTVLSLRLTAGKKGGIS
jgi:hypothetical protein